MTSGASRGVHATGGARKPRYLGNSRAGEAPDQLASCAPLDTPGVLDVAARLGCSPAQVALAWALDVAPNVVLIPGTASHVHLRENLAAAQLTLSPQTLAELDGIAAKS